MRKNNIPKKVLTYCALLSIAISSYGCSKKSDDTTDLDITYVSPSYVVDMNNPKEVVGLCTNVFVGYTEEMTGTSYRLEMPYTCYNVKVIDNIKGDLPLDSTIKLNKEGGISKDSSYYIFLENDYLPDVGKYYVFNTRERIEDNSYTASGVNCVVLIDDIDMQSDISDIKPDNSNLQNGGSIDQENDNKLMNSGIYQLYLDAYKNQIAFDPNK
ncbi:MAG: hypothetical protein E7255_13475 [Lachnospiraceae bacterium]|jgi:hypothetical protein|nr:hypothetical protein [Lachnospiraceae bacterium]